MNTCLKAGSRQIIIISMSAHDIAKVRGSIVIVITTAIIVTIETIVILKVGVVIILLVTIGIVVLSYVIL